MLPVVLTSMDVTMLHIAIPTITHELTATSAQMLWILDGYGFLPAGLLIVSSTVIGAGIAPMLTPATDVVIGSAPPHRSGAASALSETAAELGAAIGVSEQLPPAAAIVCPLLLRGDRRAVRTSE